MELTEWTFQREGRGHQDEPLDAIPVGFFRGQPDAERATSAGPDEQYPLSETTS